jgi:hypothetical protein
MCRRDSAPWRFERRRRAEARGLGAGIEVGVKARGGVEPKLVVLRRKELVVLRRIGSGERRHDDAP